MYGEGGEALGDEVWGGSGDTEFVTLLANAKIPNLGNSLVVQWLGLHAFTAEGLGSIPGQRTKIPQAASRGQKKNKIPDFTLRDTGNFQQLLSTGM